MFKLPSHLLSRVKRSAWKVWHRLTARQANRWKPVCCSKDWCWFVQTRIPCFSRWERSTRSTYMLMLIVCLFKLWDTDADEDRFFLSRFYPHLAGTFVLPACQRRPDSVAPVTQVTSDQSLMKCELMRRTDSPLLDEWLNLSVTLVGLSSS